MATVVVERAVTCRAEKSSLWCAVADTERMNRAIGMGAVTPRPLDAEGAARFTIATVSGGFPLEYEERPFEFTENERFVVHRKVTKGMVRSLEHEFRLEAREGGGTIVHVRFQVEAPSALLVPVIKLQLGRFAAKVEQELRRVDDDAMAGKPACFRDTRSELNEAALARAAAKLQATLPPERQPFGQKLVQFVREGSDADVTRIRPFELAHDLGVPERDMLATCLNAVEAGLCELSWDLVCPSCRTATDRMSQLSEIPEAGHCQLCDISYELEFDRAVEATFQPSPAIRTRSSGPFCIGGPFLTPHVITQAILPARGEVKLRAPLAAGRFRLFVRGGGNLSVTVSDSGERDKTVFVGESTIDSAPLSLAPGAEITVQQDFARERHVKLERLEWASRAATAHAVSTLPEFRRAFGADVLRSGARLKVARVALLFTDLTGSTALYDRAGDAIAFHMIHEHFALLGRIVDEYRGSIVKTIGDAVMAAFVEERDAVRCAVAMHRAFPEFRAKNPEARDLYLRVGVHAGPCYVVTANNILDYFGQTVNVAARLQGAAGTGELVMTSAALEHASELEWLADCGASAEHFQAKLKGVREEQALGKLLVDPPQQHSAAPPGA
jgi:adenylate cyclase